jgi:hypothetical protein
VLADRAFQHGEAIFDSVEHRPLRDRALDLDFNFMADVR